MNYLDYLDEPKTINNKQLANKLYDAFNSSTFFGGDYPQFVASFVTKPRLYQSGNHIVATFNFNATTNNKRQTKRCATNTFRYQIEARKQRNGQYTIVHKNLTQIAFCDTQDLKYRTKSKRMMNNNLAKIFNQFA